ncbi:putative cytochrome P450 [Aureobasidium sp. EXF-10727]|nr:putative cytochrome P450 [Aureobasidium sp. EXF-10727]
MFLIYLLPILFILFFLYTCLKSPLSKLPGPFYTKLTPLYLIYKEFTGQRRLYIDSLHSAYGPIIRISPTECTFASYEAMKEIYTSGGSGYDRTEFYELFMQFGTKTLFSMPPRGEHSQRKRLLADRYANSNILRPETVDGLTKRAKRFLENCLREEGADADVYVHLHCFALDGASQHLFAPYGTNSLEDPEDFKIMQEMSYADSLRAPYLEYYAPKIAELFDRLNSKRSRSVPLANEFVLQAVQKPNPASYSLLSKLHSKASELEDLSAAAECMDHLAAGIDTTGDGLCFLMHEISLPENAHIQDRLREEINSSNDKSFDQLPYLDAVVKEGLRVFPPIPMSFPRYTPYTGAVLDGYYIPGHTIVSCQPFTLHKDPVVFPLPEKFDPQRWLEDKGELERNRMFFAFSQGARGCIGKHLALAEMKILLREVYGKYKTVLGREKADMRFDDQVISSRPKGQKCRLRFEKVV